MKRSTPNRSDAMCNFTIRLDRKLRDEIRQVSSSQQISQAEVIRLAIQDGLSKIKIYNFDEQQTAELTQAITDLFRAENKIISREDQLINSLRKVGNNINQIARACNQKKTISETDLEHVNNTILAFEKLRKEAAQEWRLLSIIRQRMERRL